MKMFVHHQDTQLVIILVSNQYNPQVSKPMETGVMFD
jgi:hypothetical protein